MAGSCVRVDPPFVQFNDIKVGHVYKATVTITNVGKTSKRIFIQKPASKFFKFTAASLTKVVAPGLSVSGLLVFTPEEEEEVRDCLLIHIEDVEMLEIPLLGFPRACSLIMDSVLDFGCIAANSQVVTKCHAITNQGTAPGMFQVLYSRDPSVRLSPCRGVIAAGSTQWLKVELRTDEPQQIDKKALIKLQNCSAVALSIKAEVVDQHLEIFDLQGAPLSCLWFGPVYFGTSSMEKVILRNKSPQACDWVCVVQDTAAGTEVAADLQRSTDAALLDRMEKRSPACQDVSQILVVFPKQGRLGPYEKTTVGVCFSPICLSTIGKKKCDYTVSRQDYCLFLLFDSVGSRHGFTHHSGNNSVELAVTGSGLPVSLVPSPSSRFEFLTYVTGQRVDLLCVLQNLCPQLPVNFQFRNLMRFTAVPSSGIIAPGQCQDIVLSFTARQQGSFQVCQILDILGYVVNQSCDNVDVIELELRSFHTITLHLSAVCRSETKHPVPKLNPGITPPMTNSTGSWPHILSSELKHCRGMAHAAILCADKTQLHLHSRKRSQNTEGKEYLAFSNDQASSIRPASSPRQYRTIFTGVPRYRYVDTNYAFTEEEEEQRLRHRQIYSEFIKQLRQTRLSKIKEKHQEKVEDDVDIGLVPSQGLVPPKLCLSDMESSKISEAKPKYQYASSGPPCCSPQDLTSITQQVTIQGSEVMNAVPTNSQEMADCRRTLTAQELYEIVIGPLLVDFGKVCVQSMCVQKLKLINHLSVYVWVQLEVDCPELQGSSPLSYVLPPFSHNTLPLTFQSNTLGHFYRPVSYSINQQHPGQILVQAQVVPLALELSTTLLELTYTPPLLTQSGYRTSVTLRNQHNHAAKFTWKPIVTERGILFSIRPAAGTVEPYRELDCEVVWHPSFTSPEEGDFDLCIHKGNTQRLHCVAKVGSTSVQLAEKRLIFESVPLNMPSVRTAVLHNTGQNHAYYQVLDVCPLPGMVVSPSEGVVPSGGQAVFKIHFRPDSIFKFDTRVEIALRNMKSIELRVGGSVEPPNVDISVSHFQFYGVFAGSRRMIPFTLTNHSSAAAGVTFDLSEYAEFSLQFPQTSAKPGVSFVEVPGYQTVDCSLVFSPTEAATFDFDLPLMVNGVRWPPSLSSSSTSYWSLASSSKHMVKPLSHSVKMPTQQSQRIQATVLRAPLQLSPSSLEFHVETLAPQSETYTKTAELKAVCEESMYWRSVISQHLQWWFDCSATAVPTEDGKGRELCTVSPSSGNLGPGQSICLAVSIRPEAIRTVTTKLRRLSLPLYLGNEQEKRGQEPYQELSIIIHIHLPSITINPPQILLTPVPLESSAVATLTLMAVGYPSGTRVSAEVNDVQLENGTKIQPFSVVFPEGNSIPAQMQDQKHQICIHNQDAEVTSLICNVSFCSSVPLSLCTTITFTDSLHNRFKVKLFAISDNCLLTVWPYMALHHTEQQIVLKTGSTAVEVILQHYRTPSPAPGLVSSSSSFDHNSSTNKKSASDLFPDSDSVSSQTSRDEEFCPNRDSPANLGIPTFPVANSDETPYHQNVILAVERWFSLFGWPSGPYPISIPYTLRRVVSKVHTAHSSGRTYRVSQNKDSRSVMDMLHHLTGKQIPGVPCCQTFSSDTNQHINQLLQQHEAMLAFLRVQGALLCHIRPEYLLDVQEFKHWCSLQSNEGKHSLDYSSVDYESLSKRSWTDVLLQVYKVLVLCRVSESCLNTSLKQEEGGGILPVNSQPLASNIYSAWELKLLSWLNVHYENMRETIWDTGVPPSARWIVNFDLDLTDGLVLAALVAAYCPYLIYSHFQRMYTTTSSLEQILHNNIIVVQALTALSLNIDVQSTDLSDPNPVQMLMLCVHLYERLPQYLPQDTITLSGALHSTLSKQVRLKNPSSKPVTYQAFLLGQDAHLFSLPGGCTVTLPPKASSELTIQCSCSFLQPMEAVLLLISNSVFGQRATTLSFILRTHISHITPTNTVKCKSPCYQLKVIQLPITNPFSKEAKFRMVLVESAFNPLEPEKKNNSLVQQASASTNLEKLTSDKSCGEEMEGKLSDLNGESSEFLSAVRSIYLKSGQVDTLNIHYLPFYPGTKYCSVLLVCPQVGDMVYIVKATAELPLPSSLTTKPSSNIVSITSNSGISLCCKVGQVCEKLVCVPRINMAWEQALAIWGQLSMSSSEHRRRMLTRTLHSSTVRTTTALHKLFKKQVHLMRSADHNKVVEYSVEVSLPQYFTLPTTVEIPIEEHTHVPWENPADCSCVDIPLRFQADSVGQFTCQVVLRSWCDIRVYILEALVTSQGGSVHFDFTAPAHRSVTQDIPLYNETAQDWNIQAEVCGEGFSGPNVLNVASGTRAYYPLTFHPSAQCVVMGKLSLHNSCDGTEHIFTLRGVGEHPLPVDHVVLHCPVGKTTYTQLNVPNYSHKKRTLKVVTDLSIVSGSPFLEIKSNHSSPYMLAVTPWKRGNQRGSVAFVETDDTEEADNGCILGHYKVYFSLEVICEPAAPVKVIDVQCVAQSSVTIEIPVNNPERELLKLKVYLEGDSLSGASWISVPSQQTVTYTATFSPGSVGKGTGCVVFQSELVQEVWYQLELYALPPPAITVPQACCQLGKWTRLTIPVVNPNAETLELMVTNSNPRNYALEMDSGNTLVVEPHSSTQLNVHFIPSSIGKGNHTAKITFTSPQLQEWCVLLSGCGLNPEYEKPLSILSVIGFRASIVIPFTNPTKLPATLTIKLTDKEPKAADCHLLIKDKDVFSVPLSQTKGIRINEGASFDVPVVFAPNSMELQQAWLCITMKTLSSTDNSLFTNTRRSEEELPVMCWIYPLRGIPVEMPVENSQLGMLQCEAGCQLEKKVDVLLTGCVLGNQDRKGQEVLQVPVEDFLCEVFSNSRAECSEVKDYFSASIEAAKRDPETDIVTLKLCLLYTPLKPCRHSAVIAVQHLSERTWGFSIDLIATEPQVDDVIFTKATELGKTSAVGFRLTSTTRRPEPFTVAFVSGSSSEFTVTPSSGILPPVGSSGDLITVFFTPTMHHKVHRARLTIQAADMRWTYEVRGKTQ